MKDAWGEWVLLAPRESPSDGPRASPRADQLAESWPLAAARDPRLVAALARRGGGSARRASLLVFGISLVACYGASALYHGVRAPVRADFGLRDGGLYRNLRADCRVGHADRLDVDAGPLASIRPGPGLGVGGGRCTLQPHLGDVAPADRHGVLPRDGLGGGPLLLRDRAAGFASRPPADLARGRLLQRRGGHQPAGMARLPAGGLRAPRAVPPVRDGREPLPLLVHADGGRPLPPIRGPRAAPS